MVRLRHLSRRVVADDVLLVDRRAAFETVALAAARLGPISLSAQSVIMTTDQSTYRDSLSCSLSDQR